MGIHNRQMSYESEKKLWHVVILLTVGRYQNLMLNFKPQGSNPSLKAQIPATMLKSQPQGTKSNGHT